MLGGARDFALEAATSASARLAETPNDLRPMEVSKLLNSRLERDVLKGLKYVISLISSGSDASEFFTDVVKNVTSSNLKIRKLVYTYLLRYADKESETALLSINAIQKSFGDKNPQVRALALRVISEIRIPSIYPIVLLGIKKCASDPSERVRQAAAISLVKLFNNYGPSSNEDLIDFIRKLLADKDLSVLSSTILAFKIICPSNFELIHGHFRRLCSIITKLDEWAQTYLIEILTNYARLYIPKPKLFNQASNQDEYIELPDNYNEIPFPVYEVEFDPDLNLFLDSIKFLVYSRNEAVILAVSRAFFHLAPPQSFKESQVAASLVRTLLTSSLESQNFILQSILYVAVHDPTLFVQYEKRFYLLPKDDTNNAKFKIRILSVICNENNIKTIINELQYYTLNSEIPELAKESVKAIGVCSQISDYWSSKTLKWLLNELLSPQLDNEVMSEFLTVIRYLVQDNPQSNIKTVIKLAKLLDNDSLAEGAKEIVIWLVGEFSGIEPKLGPDVLRKLLKNFSYEKPSIRYQIILTAAKIYSNNIGHYKQTSGDEDMEKYDFDGIIPKMFFHAIQLGKYDDEYDTRDRARMLYSLLSSKQTQLATLILEAPKPVPLVSLKRTDPLDITVTEAKKDYVRLLPVDDLIKSYNILPKWADQKDLPASSIRDEIESLDTRRSIQPQSMRSGVSTSNSGFGNEGRHSPQIVKEKKYKLQSLDDFFAEEDPKPQIQRPLKKKIIYEEESESEEESEEAEESDEEEEGESEEEEESSEEEHDSSEEHEVFNASNENLLKQL